jgi:ABC-type branched-subunit amino acid transport system permease subunit
MMNQTLKNASLSGIVFGTVIILSSLIGLTVIMSQILQDFLKIESQTGNYYIGLALVMALFGLWAGMRGAKPTEPDTLAKAAVGGLLAGFIAGVLVAVYALIIGTLAAEGVNMRAYLAQLSPAAVDQFLYGFSPQVGALIQAGLLTISALLGGLLAWAVGRGRIRSIYQKNREKLRSSWTSSIVYNRIQTFAYTDQIVYGFLIILAIMLPLTLGQYWNFTLGTVGIYVLMGLGINIVVGLAGLLDLGYVAFFAVGAYVVGLLTSPQMLPQFQMNFWIAGTLGIAIAALTGIILGFPVLRLRGDYLAIVTLGFGEIIRILVRSDLLSDYVGGPQGIRDIAGPSLFGFDLSNDRAYLILIILSILLAIFVTVRLQNSRVGRAWVAMREDETVAQAMGINTYTHKLMAFAIGAAFAGLGGVIFASRNQYIGPEDANLLVSINVLAVVIVGGMGSIPGVFLGAFVLKGLPEILRQLQDYRILAFGALLVVMMIVRPEGLWPSTRRKLEMHEEPPGIGPTTEPPGEMLPELKDGGA